MSCGRFGNEPLPPNVSIFLRSSEILEGLRNRRLKNEDGNAHSDIAESGTPVMEDSGLRKGEFSPNRENIHLAEKADAIIIDDDDEAQTHIAEPPTKRKTLMRSQSSRNGVSDSFSATITANRPHPDVTVPLNALQKWGLCTMWRTNKSLSDIASTLNAPEAILQTYIYDLIKQDAMKSSRGSGGHPARSNEIRL